MVKNIGDSTYARLRNLARQHGQQFDAFLTRFVLERLLFRLSDSRFSDQFVLKGAMLLATWLPDFQRMTHDLDLLGRGSNVSEEMAEIFREVMGIECADGVEFDMASIRVRRIREEQEYGGLRLKARATLSKARISVSVDIGFGDAVAPGLQEIEYPSLLDFPAPKIRAYPPETVIAEKFQAMIALGRTNSRMKDYYDVWILSRVFNFDHKRLAQAISATFHRRGTEIPAQRPDVFTQAFSLEPTKTEQWKSLAKRFPDAPPDFAVVVKEIADFLMPVAIEANAEETKGKDQSL